MRVVHVVAPAGIGGLERVVQLLASAQHAAGDSVAVAAIVAPEDPSVGDRFLAPIAAAGASTHRIEVGARAYLRERGALRSLCDALKPDVVHTHGYHADVVDGTALHSPGRGTVCTAHGFVGGNARNRGYEWLQRRAFRRFGRVAAVSRGVADKIIGSGVAANRVRVVPNAWQKSVEPLERLTAREALGVPADGFRIGWVGRVEHEKGLDVLVDALARLAFLPIHASVLGDGRLRGEAESRAAGFQLNGRIRWHGMVPGAERMLPAFDAVVLSSRTEGSPMILLESMAAQVPIVATAVGGVPTMVSSREAILVPPDDPEALADAIRSAFHDRESAAVRSEAARERLLREFAVGPWIGAYHALYQDAVAEASQ